jgi:hypothetical protein
MMRLEFRYWWLGATRVVLVVLAVILLVGSWWEAVRLFAFREVVGGHHTRVGWAWLSMVVGTLTSVVLVGMAQAVTLLFNVRRHQLGASQTDLEPPSGLPARLASLRQLRD